MKFLKQHAGLGFVWHQIGLLAQQGPSSISIRRAMEEIGTSLAPPSNGLDEVSPTFSSVMNAQPTKTLAGTLSHTVQDEMPCARPASQK